MENISRWRAFDWRHGGDEWSYWWGGPRDQWRATVYPRIQRFLPAGLLVEIAPGYGRWTQFLRRHCSRLIGVDLSQDCVEACHRRFRHDRRLTFRVNDGRTLVGVPDGSADLVFSFDSLVHVEQDVIDEYVSEIERVLTPDGVAFLHHSNMARKLAGVDGAEMPHWRARTVSADTVAATAGGLGLRCIYQELVPWGRKHSFPIDCFTTMTRPGSRYDAEPRIVENEEFMDEADRAFAAAARRRRWRPANVARAVVRRMSGPHVTAVFVPVSLLELYAC